MQTITRPHPARLLPLLALAWLMTGLLNPLLQAAEIKVGLAQKEITPPEGFPMAGYYTERLAEGTLNPLWAKAIVFQQGDLQAAWVSCDLTGLGIDLSTAVRAAVAEKTGIPTEHIVVTASHSHTAPDYYRSLYWHLGPDDEIPTEQARQRARYAGDLVKNTVEAVVQAQAAAVPVTLESGETMQQEPVSFCRRSVMTDGSVRTWVGLKHEQALRLTAPIDPRIGLLKITPQGGERSSGLISLFALHLDTVGGKQWHADYPYFIEQAVQNALGADAISLFGTGACGDINHADPTGNPRRKTDEIGGMLGDTITKALPSLTPLEAPVLQVRTETVPLLLEEVDPGQAKAALEKIKAIAAGEKPEFTDHVLAYKRLILDHMHRADSQPEALDHLSLGLSRTWKGIGKSIPTEVTVITLGRDTAFVFLPSEIFVELGLAIQNASPFRHTNIITFAQSVEMIYIPNQHAYAGGGYEVLNSLVQPGSGEKLAETAVRLLRQSATQLIESEKAE